MRLIAKLKMTIFILLMCICELLHSQKYSFSDSKSHYFIFGDTVAIDANDTQLETISISTYNQINTWISSKRPNFYDSAKFCKKVIMLNVFHCKNITVITDSVKRNTFYDKYFKDSIFIYNYICKLVFENNHLNKNDTFNLTLESPESKIEFEKLMLEFSKSNNLFSKLMILEEASTKSLYMFITYTIPMRNLKDLSIGYDFVYFKFISLVHN